MEVSLFVASKVFNLMDKTVCILTDESVQHSQFELGLPVVAIFQHINTLH